MATVLKIDMHNAPLDELASQIAALKVSGLGINNIVSQIKETTGWPITKTFLERRIETHEMYLKTIKALQDGILKKNVNQYKAKSSEALELVSEVLLRALKGEDLKAALQAIPLVLKSVGIDLPEQEQKQATVLNVILPGQAKKEKDVGQN